MEREGTKLNLRLIHVDVWQKPTQYCTAIILQLKVNKFHYKKHTLNTHIKKISSYRIENGRKKKKWNNAFKVLGKNAFSILNSLPRQTITYVEGRNKNISTHSKPKIYFQYAFLGKLLRICSSKTRVNQE